jgi:hypothetical protein
VAVTGLAGHAYGSWRNRQNSRMWLRDFLPNTVRNIQIITYGYQSNIAGNVLDDFQGILKYRRDLIYMLESARRQPKV